MRRLESYLTQDNLEAAKEQVVPCIFSENYYRILKAKIRGNKLTKNEQYYYNHFIKKKLQGIFNLLNIDENIKGKEYIKKDRLKKAISILKKYARKHKNQKLLISGSFLYNEAYNDCDVFVISKYKKEYYREGKIHINFLPESVEKTLFFQSISAISIANFTLNNKVEEEFNLSDLLHLYEVVILLIIQKDDYLQELRDLVLRLEYVSGRVILSSLQLKIITEKITKSKNPIQVIGKYVVAMIINAYPPAIIKKTLTNFIEKNSLPERGKVQKNWQIYNQTYKEAKEIVA
ncbi:hypothetical protein J4460_00240 [Candidatus Woesearchaeota archaeon]|nr:MAG: hypothetical protein QS99_C0002G0139 [archaeon GW2011_AR4]MBS3129079.1 hypothetical protein [Candidatus Woesearchaeota archaeon]HIH37813.1 hypothetical protein [Candidatus Woesearchaeota archaeon]HIH48413.1 hypothetical protein [Candidatus Woesearchaeota archaeon]HIJ03938.1 hypothetical protein [Candidatus Woesearchaeota archaeon]